jgi:hypothetical protein
MMQKKNDGDPTGCTNAPNMTDFTYREIDMAISRIESIVGTIKPEKRKEVKIALEWLVQRVGDCLLEALKK